LRGSQFSEEPEIELLGGFLEHFTIDERLEAAVCFIEYLIIKDLTGALDLKDEFLDLVLSKLTFLIDIQKWPLLIDLLLKVINDSLISRSQPLEERF
jgi:hypothetical protein